MIDVKTIDIKELIPQQPPFVMVDSLLFCDLKTTRTAFTVTEDNIFCNNGAFSEAGIAENIAQTCAARLGFLDKYVFFRPIKIGYIGAIRNQMFFRRPKVGETLVTEINIVQEIFQMMLITATVSVDNELITSCEMKIAIPDTDGK
jgi:3-hydroxymyristoyl/3-hydroxydecanoyl-(acyl carrier protein) dehydratase